MVLVKCHPRKLKKLNQAMVCRIAPLIITYENRFEQVICRLSSNLQKAQESYRHPLLQGVFPPAALPPRKLNQETDSL